MFIDLRSDTVTSPTDEMRAAMAAAPVGDDVYGDDPTVNRLEELAAEMIGKEAALFVPSGTMGNQIALLVHAGRGEEVICDSDAHVFYYENAGAAVLAGCQLRTVAHCSGVIAPENLIKAVRNANDIHMPRTALAWIENSHNRGGGVCYTPEQVEAVASAAHSRGIRLHCDGARIFNAATALGVTAGELAAPCDSVMFCLSKGLCAPVGSMLAGTKAFIALARQMRKLLGGGMRQAGILAAAGIIALEKMSLRLHEDHRRAREIAAMLEQRGLAPGKSQTNILLFDVRQFYPDAAACLQALAGNGVLATAFSDVHVRFVLHNDINDADVQRLEAVLNNVFR